MIDHQKLTELLRRNHYEFDFNSLRYQNLIDKVHFTTIDSKRFNRNAIRYKENPTTYSTRIVQANMPSLAKGKPSSAIKNATTKVKEKETTDKPTRPTKAQLAREAQAKKDAELDAILDTDWRMDPFNDRVPRADDKSSSSSEYSGLDDDSSEWTIDNEDENKTEDKPSDEDPEARKMKKNKPAEGEDSDERYGRAKGGKPEKMATPKPPLVTMSKQSLMRTKLALEQYSRSDDEEDLSTPDKMNLQSPKRRTDSRKRIMPNTPPVAQRLRRLKKISKTTPRLRPPRNQVTRKTVISKNKNASDKVQRKAVVNPYTSKGDKKAITFGGNEIRYFEKNNEELNFSQLDSLQLEDYDSSGSSPPTDQTTPNKETSWPKTVDEDQDLPGILFPSGSEESDNPRPEAVDVGGDGNCAYCAVADQALGSPKYHLALRAATANELSQNSESYEQDHMISGDEQVPVTVKQYAARVARPGEYAGHVELQAMARVLNHSIKVYDIDGDPNKTRIIDAYENELRNFADEYYEIEYDPKSQHYRSLHNSKFKDRRSRLQVKIKGYKETGTGFKNMVVGFTGRHIDVDGSTCGRADFINLVELHGGKVLDRCSPKMVALIVVGDNPRSNMIGYCKGKKIPIIDYNLLCLRLDFNITRETMLLLGRQFEESVESVYPFEESSDSCGTPEKLPPIQYGFSPPVFSPQDLTPLAPTRLLLDTMTSTRPSYSSVTVNPITFHPGTAITPSPFVFQPLALTAPAVLRSSIKSTNTNPIPINEIGLDLSRNSMASAPSYNTRPPSKTESETFLQIAFNHSADEDYDPVESITARFRSAFGMMLEVDPDTKINPAWSEADPQNLPPTITKVSNLPIQWIPLQKYLYVNNPRTVNPPYEKDGVRKSQSSTYTTLRISTSVDPHYMLNLMQPDISKLNMRINIKPLSILSTITPIAIIGTISGWHAQSMNNDLTAEIGELVERNQQEGFWAKFPEFYNRAPPLFHVRYQRVQVSKTPIAGTTDEERQFEEGYQNHRSLLVIDCPEQDERWLQTVFDLYRKEGLLKILVSKQCTIIDLPGFGIPDPDHFAKSVRNHMILSLTHMISQITDVASMNAAVKVEMEEGYILSKKTTTLKRELLDLRLGAKEDGTEGEKYICGAQYVTSGNSTTGGKILLMHSYKPQVVQMILNLLRNPVAYIYLYLRKKCHYSERCVRKGISMWYISPNRTADSSLNTTTNVMSTRAQSSHTIYQRDMEKADCINIPDHIREEMAMSSKVREQETAMERLSDIFGITDRAAPDFSCINSTASALTTTSHTTDGKSSIRSVTSKLIHRHLDAMREERCQLMSRLREMNPEHPIFSTSEFDDDMDYLSDAEDSLNDANQVVLYRETRRHISQLKVLISQSASESLVVVDDSSAISITGTEETGEKNIREVEQLPTTGDHMSDAEGSVVNLEAEALVVADVSSVISSADQAILLRGGGDGDPEDSWDGESGDNQGNEVGNSEEGKRHQVNDNESITEESASTGLGLGLTDHNLQEEETAMNDGTPTVNNQDDDGSAQPRGGAEDGDDLGGEENKDWGNNWYGDSDDNEADKMAETEEEREWDARFRRECRAYDQENEADTMDDTETEEEREASFQNELSYRERLWEQYLAAQEEELADTRGTFFINGLEVGRTSPTTINEPLNNRLVVHPSRVTNHFIEQVLSGPAPHQGEEEDSGEEKEAEENLSIEDEESSDESSDWSTSGGVTVFVRGINAVRIHPNEGTVQGGDGWGRLRPRFDELLPNNNAEPPRGASQEEEESGQRTTEGSREEYNNSTQDANVFTSNTETASLLVDSHAVNYNAEANEEMGEEYIGSRVGANASTASDEATIGTRPPTRASANPPGSVALGSKTDNPDGVVQGS